MEINTILMTVLGFIKGFLAFINMLFGKLGGFGDILMIAGLIWVSWKISKGVFGTALIVILTLAFYLLIKFAGGIQ